MNLYEITLHDTESIYLLAPTKYRALELVGDYLADAGQRDTLLRSGKFVVRQVDLSEEQILRPEKCRACLLVPGFGGHGPRLGLGGSLFLSSGSRPTQYYQPLIRFTTPAYRRMSWYGEWRYYGFAEPFYLYEGFRTHLVTVGLRFTR